MRGEHTPITDMHEVGEGSSPHARGTLAADTEIDVPAGIIPACAGNTITVTPATTEIRDHPRMRGEHTKKSQ